MEPSYYIPKQEQTFLNLTRPIVFYDLESTGTSTTTDRIIEICAIKVNVDGSQEELYHLVNPTIPIAAGATAVHGITDEMVAGKPTFGDLAEELTVFFKGCDLGGYNIKRFDVPMLMEELYRHGISIDLSEVKLIDAMAIYHSKEKRDLSAAVKFYCGRDHEGAHAARADVLATIDILKHQLLRYEDLEPNTSFLHDYLHSGNNVDFAGRFVRDEEGRIIFNFGKHQGKEACTQPDYLNWIIKGDFAADTKMVAQRILNNCTWESEYKKWLNDSKIGLNNATVAALYTTVKFGCDVFPFSLKCEGEKLTVMYLTEPPSSIILANEDAKQVLLNILDNFFVKKGIPLPEQI